MWSARIPPPSQAPADSNPFPGMWASSHMERSLGLRDICFTWGPWLLLLEKRQGISRLLLGQVPLCQFSWVSPHRNAFYRGGELWSHRIDDRIQESLSEYLTPTEQSHLGHFSVKFSGLSGKVHRTLSPRSDPFPVFCILVNDPLYIQWTRRNLRDFLSLPLHFLHLIHPCWPYFQNLSQICTLLSFSITWL